MQKVIIIGNCGSGKTTFAKKLGQKTGLPIIHPDRAYWHGSWQTRDRDAFDAALQQALDKPCWIMDGNYHRTLPYRLEHCDTVFFFDLPTITCLWGITRRVIANYGRTRPDMGGNCPERFDRNKWALYRNVFLFNRQHREQYLTLLKGATGVNVTVFRNRKQAERFLDSL